MFVVDFYALIVVISKVLFVAGCLYFYGLLQSALMLHYKSGWKTFLYSVICSFVLFAVLGLL